MRFLLLITFLFSSSLFAYQLNPTPPSQVDDSHNEPVPDFSMCSTQFTVCGYESYTSFVDENYLAQVCGDPYWYEIFSITAGDPLGCLAEEVPGVPTNCLTCDCPSGQIRDGHQCVIDQQCNYGIRNYQTGACYDYTCPYGDGTDAACGRVPACVPSEGTTLITDGEGSSCECTFNKVWDADLERCEYPSCNGANGSPIASVFDTEQNACLCPSTHSFNSETNTCVQVSCSEPDEIFVAARNQCEVPPDCLSTQDLDAVNNVCISNQQVDDSQCDLIDHNVGYALSVKPEYECFSPARVQYYLYGAGGDTDFYDWCPAHTIFWSHAQDWLRVQETQKRDCHQCLADGKYPTLYNRNNAYGAEGLSLWYGSCDTPETFCIVRQGVWNDYHDVCMNPGFEAYEVPVRSSSSSSSLASSSLSSSLSSSSVASTGGNGNGSNSSGSGTGGGGDPGEGGEGGSGGSGGSAASASSVAASSAASVASVAASVSSQNNSAANSANNSAASSANNSAAGSSSGGGQGSSTATSSGSGGNGGNGGNGGEGEGGSGGSAGNSSAGGGNSSASNSSSAGECDPESSDYLDCIGDDKKPFSPHTIAESGATTFGEANQLFLDAITGSPLVQSFDNFSNAVDVSNAECVPFEIDLTDALGVVLSTTIICDVLELIRPILASIMLAVFAIAAFRIFASS